MLKLPKFENEAEEARWWYENQDSLAEEFHHAATNGTLKSGTAMRRSLELEAASTVQLDPSDISKARPLAEKRGLDYQAYLQTLIHEALEREEKLSS
jgi:predicted DNA binding CopG/RHH family protein